MNKFQEPKTKRAIVFIDGQNLFYSEKEAFGYTYPNYDPKALAEKLCEKHRWRLSEVYFYTGIPAMDDDEKWHLFWMAKLSLLGRLGVKVYSRPLRYRNQTIKLQNGQHQTILVGQEKGIDIRIALDVVRLARDDKYDVCIIISQDQDLTEVVDEVKSIAMAKNRWIKVVSAFPQSPTSRNRRGIDKTDWIKIDKMLYDSCLDKRVYTKK